jgi:hypothetical protein
LLFFFVVDCHPFHAKRATTSTTDHDLKRFLPPSGICFISYSSASQFLSPFIDLSVTRCLVLRLLFLLGLAAFCVMVSPERSLKFLRAWVHERVLIGFGLLPSKVSLLVLNIVLPLISIITVDVVATGLRDTASSNESSLIRTLILFILFFSKSSS